MKNYLAFLLVSLFIWQSFFKTAFIIYWKINQNYIAQNLCKNKDIPTMHCNGKCYLMKNLKKVEENESSKNQIPASILNLKLFDFILLYDSTFELPNRIKKTNTKCSFFNSKSSLLDGFEKLKIKPPISF